MARSRRSREQVDIWPGFVDAISTLLLSIIFLLIVFVLGQFFLGQMLQGRTETVQRLQGQVKDLSSQLGLEQDAAADLRRTLARLNSDLGQAFRERDDLKGELARADAERDRLGEQVATMTDQQGRVQRDLAEAQKAVAADKDTIQALNDAKARLEAQAASLGQTQATTVSERDKALQAAKTLTDQIATLGRQLAAIDQALGAKQQEIDRQNAQIADLGAKLNVALASKVEELTQYRSDFFGRLRQALGSREDVRIVGDRFVFQSEVLFPSGSADISAEGQSQLAKLAGALKDMIREIPPDLPWVLQVDGHTDRRPISSSRFPSNWELSTARAIAVARFLVSQGIPPDRVAARGFAEFQPLDPGEGEDSYRRNRRIEIKLTTR